MWTRLQVAAVLTLQGLTAPPQQPTGVISDQAAAILNLLQTQVDAQQNVLQGAGQSNQPLVMALHEVYQFLMSQGRRVPFARRQGGDRMLPKQ